MFLRSRLGGSRAVLAFERSDSRAINDPVWVEHGDDLEDEGLPQALGHGVTATQELQSPLHHPAGIALPRVDAC